MAFPQTTGGEDLGKVSDARAMLESLQKVKIKMIMGFWTTFNMVVYGIGLIAGVFLSIVLHELGHLACGRLSGYRFVSFRLMKWHWARGKDGKIKLTKDAGLGVIAGQCLMDPGEDEGDLRFVLYNLGGGLTNLLTGAFSIASFFIIYDEFVRFFLFGIGVSALLLGGMNLVPRTVGGIPNDGKSIKEALKSSDARHGFYLMLKVNADMSKGKFVSDYDEQAFSVNAGADLSNFFVGYIIMLRSQQLEEQGAYEQSYQELLRLDAASLPPYYSGVVELGLMFHELVYFEEESFIQIARKRMEEKAKDKLFQKILGIKHPAFLVFVAAKNGIIDGDEEKAREIIALARKLASSLQNPGQEHSIALMLDRLESRICQK